MKKNSGSKIGKNEEACMLNAKLWREELRKKVKEVGWDLESAWIEEGMFKETDEKDSWNLEEALEWMWIEVMIKNPEYGFRVWGDVLNELQRANQEACWDQKDWVALNPRLMGQVRSLWRGSLDDLPVWMDWDEQENRYKIRLQEVINPGWNTIQGAWMGVGEWIEVMSAMGGELESPQETQERMGKEWHERWEDGMQWWFQEGRDRLSKHYQKGWSERVEGWKINHPEKKGIKR